MQGSRSVKGPLAARQAADAHQRCSSVFLQGCSEVMCGLKPPEVMASEIFLIGLWDQPSPAQKLLDLYSSVDATCVWLQPGSSGTSLNCIEKSSWFKFLDRISRMSNLRRAAKLGKALGHKSGEEELKKFGVGLSLGNKSLRGVLLLCTTP